MAVSGRAGVGRRTAARALAHTEQLALAPESDADLEVYVIAEVVKPEDRTAIAKAVRPVVTVLTKVDLIATTATARHPQGPTAAARARCEQLSARTGLPVEPLIGLLAVAELDDMMWAGLHALAHGDRLPPGVRRRLTDAVGVFGTGQAVVAIRHGATRAEVMALLRRLSCIDEVVDAIEVRGAAARYRRVLDAVADLEALAVTDARVSDFLTRDDTVVARMVAAVDAVEAGGVTVDRGTTLEAHLQRALAWRSDESSAGSDIVRGSLRLWAEVGGSV